MLPTISDEGAYSYSQDNLASYSKVLKKTEPDTPPYSHHNSKPTTSSHSNNPIKSSQPRKRASSPHSPLQFYPTLRCSTQPYTKLTKTSSKVSNNSNSNSIKNSPYKKTTSHVPDQANKSLKSAYGIPVEHPARKSLPHNNLVPREQQPLQTAPMSIKDSIKGISREQDHPRSTLNSRPSYYNGSAGSKTSEKQSISIHENTIMNDKSNGDIQNNYQRYLGSGEREKRSSASQYSADKILLHSASKHNNTVETLESKTFDSLQTITEETKSPRKKEGQLREVLVQVLKKPPNSPGHAFRRENEHSVQPIMSRLSLNQTDIRAIGKSNKKDSDRSPSLNSIPRKHLRESGSLSPTKKTKNQLSEKISKTSVQSKSNAIVIKKPTATAPAAPVVYLSEEEKAQYGDRTLPDYDKLELLGKGGFALVWMGQCKKTKRRVAMKQMTKTGGGEAKKNDLFYGQLLFKEGGEPRDEFKNFPGIQNIAAFIDYKATNKDDWHISELCGRTISSLLFDIKGEFCKGERVYAVKNLALHHQFRTDGRSLKLFIKKMAEALDLFSNYYIVHCDIKPENVLLTVPNPKEPNFNLKIIDFGSAYNWGDSGSLRMATPEYMPPEFLNLLIGRNASNNSIEQLAEISNPWSVDVWSLGAMLIEIISGIPLWIPLKCKIDVGSKSSLRFGLFAAKGRAYDKIYLKQKALSENLRETLGEYLEYWRDSKELYDLLVNMMRWDPKKRISPTNILKHPFLQDV